MYRLKRENATSTDGKVTVQADKDRLKINIDGKSTQDTRDGYNRLPTKNITRTINGVTFTPQNDGSVLVNGTATENAVYPINVNSTSISRTVALKANTNYKIFQNKGIGSSSYIVQAFFNKNGKLTYADNQFQTTEETASGAYVLVYKNAVLNNVIVYPQITEGTEEKPYEQYGVSPSPDYPSEIKSIGDDINLINDADIINGSLSSGNIVSGYGYRLVTNNPIPVKSSTDYNINFRNIGEFKGVRVGIHSYDAEGNFISDSGWVSFTNLQATIKTGANWKSVRFVFSFSKTSTSVTTGGTEYTGNITPDEFKTFKVKFQEGSKATSYSKYGEGTLNIEQSGKNKLINSSFRENTTGWYLNNNGTIAPEITEKLGQKCLHITGELQKVKYFSQSVQTRVEKNKTYTLSAMVYLENYVPGTTNNFVALYTDGKTTSDTWTTGIQVLSGHTGFGPSLNDYSKGFVKVTATLKVLDDTDLTKALGLYIYARDFTGDLYVYDVQLEESTEATDYEEYFNNTYTLPLKPLRSLPNGVKDTLEADGIHRAVGFKEFDGSSDEGWILNNTDKLRYPFGIDISDAKVTPTVTEANNILSNQFIANATSEDSETYKDIATFRKTTYNQRIWFFVPKTYFTKTTSAEILAEFKTMIANNPIQILYELANKTTESYTDEQKEVINSMVTEKGTNIFNINEDTGITLNYTPEFTDEIKHAFKYGITRGYLEVLDGSGLIINEDNYLQSIDFNDERYVDGEGIIGTAAAKSLEGKFINVDSKFSVENKELQAYVGADLDDGTTKYIDLGTFIVQKPDNNNVTDNTSFNALDYMVKFNKTYVDNITYPCTLGELLQNVCDQVNIVLKTKTFRNSTFEIENNTFINNESCREVIKAIAQMAFSWARINQDNELVLDFDLSDEITETINNDEYYELKDNEQYGPVNTIILRNSQVEGENYTIIDPNKLSTDKTCELVISDNPFAYTQAKRQELIQAGSALFGFKYIPLTTKTIGSVYLNCQDKLRVKNMQDKNLDTYIFNNKISYDGRITDIKETSAMTETETKYQFTDTMANKLNAKMARTEIIVDKANQQITAVVEQIGDRSEKTTTITADIDGLNSKVSQIEDITDEKNGVQSVILENCAEGELLELHIYGNNTVFKYNTLSDSLILGDNLILGNKTSSTIIVQNEKGEKTDYNLNIPGVLRQNGTTKDEYIIQDGKAIIIRRINTDGSIKSVPTTEELGAISIKLSSGNNTVSIKDFSAEMKIKYVIKTDLTDIFASRVELSSSIQQTSSQIMTQVNKKVGEEELGTKIIQDYESVQIAWNKIDELIQFINGKLKILNQNKETLMTLDKTGQHFFEGEEEFGNMGINVVDNNKYISFSVNGEYGQAVENGMAWGITTKSDNKFFPIFFIKNFDIAPEASDNYYGQLVLTACDLVLQGINTGIISGNMKMLGGDIGGELNFIDTNTDSILLQIVPENYQLGTSESINMLNNAIKFYKNQAGSSSFKIGTSDSNYCLFTDEGDIHTAGGFVMLGTSDYKTDVSIYPNSTVNIWNGNLNVDGNVYADNISSDERLKNNIQDSETNATENLNKFKIKSFDWKKDDSHIKTGFIAQQLEEIDEDYVLKKPEYNENKEIKDYRYYINELPILATLVKGFQEQQQVIKNLNNTIEEMKKEINKLKEKEENNG